MKKNTHTIYRFYLSSIDPDIKYCTLVIQTEERIPNIPSRKAFAKPLRSHRTHYKTPTYLFSLSFYIQFNIYYYSPCTSLIKSDIQIFTNQSHAKNPFLYSKNILKISDWPAQRFLPLHFTSSNLSVATVNQTKVNLSIYYHYSEQ